MNRPRVCRETQRAIFEGVAGDTQSRSGDGMVVKYATAGAFRAALEARLKARQTDAVGLSRLRSGWYSSDCSPAVGHSA
jgi:hypothetical protein